MNPVICFYETENYIYSTDYHILTCPAYLDATSFLNAIESEHADKMKIIQVNFEAYHTALFKNQNLLYDKEKATVYILNTYTILSIREIKIKHSNLLTSSQNFLKKVSFQLQTTKSAFLESVELIKTMIAAGRFYQINLASSLTCQLKMPGLQFFLQTYGHFPGNYKSFLPLENDSIISFSPELFLEKKQFSLRTQPIKGSVSKTENTILSLLKSEKEEAELSMIVDLLRNDLNSLEAKNSAVVTSHRQLMDLNYIHHTFSEVKINTTKTLPFILQRMMPGGSISGCPKLESLITLSELEKNKRQVYAGTIGWWKNNDFKLSIAIRTFIQSKESYFYFAGCGIVYDSLAEKEFNELLNKTGTLNVQYI